MEGMLQSQTFLHYCRDAQAFQPCIPSVEYSDITYSVAFPWVLSYWGIGRSFLEKGLMFSRMSDSAKYTEKFGKIDGMDYGAVLESIYLC